MTMAEKKKKNTEEKDPQMVDPKELETLKQQVEEAEKKATEAEEALAKAEEKENERKNEYLRLMAEFDTFRRRTAEEKLELVRSASADTIKGLLPVLDDCEIALTQLEKTEGNEAAIEGVQLIFNKLMGYLKTKGLEPIAAKGEVFDTELHDPLPRPERGPQGQGHRRGPDRLHLRRKGPPLCQSDCGSIRIWHRKETTTRFWA